MKKLFEKIAELKETAPPTRSKSKGGWEDVAEDSPPKGDKKIKKVVEADYDDDEMDDEPPCKSKKVSPKKKQKVTKVSPTKKCTPEKVTKASPMKVSPSKSPTPTPSPKKVIKDKLKQKATEKGNKAKAKGRNSPPKSPPNPKSLPKEETPMKPTKKYDAGLISSDSGKKSSSSGRDPKTKQLHQENLRIVALMKQIS